ncbi:MAG: Fe-S cluster assembly protein SufD [Cyclobacteriaceae bacterium]
MQNLSENVASAFRSFEQGMNGESTTSFHEVRKTAFQQLTNGGFPALRAEEYKFTPLTKSIEKGFNGTLVTTDQEVTQDFIDKHVINGLDAYTIVFVNGKITQIPAEVENGLTISSLWDAYQQNPEAVLAQFGKIANPENDAFLAWNTAFTKHGLYIKVEKKALIEKPIMIYHFVGAQAENTINSRNLVLVEESAQVSINESVHTQGEANSFANLVSEIFVGKNARVEFTKVQNDLNTAYQFGHTQVHQERDSHFKANTITMNGAMIRNNVNITIDDENCEAHMYGIYVLNGKSHVDNHTVVDHRKPNSYSNELYKGVVDEKAKGVFNGKIFVRQEAQKTNAFQSNNNILLSDTATVNTKPQLEIWADDVKCSHGCTVGQLDEDAIFYLRARGIDERSAKAMLLYAFAKDVLENVSVEPLRERLDQLVSQRLHTNE